MNLTILEGIIGVGVAIIVGMVVGIINTKILERVWDS